MSYTNFQKTIALSGGVLVLSVAVALVVIAWTGPTAEPPLNNAPEPLNTGSSDQVKTGGLTVKELSLDDGTGKGDIINADDITGGNDLFLHSATNQSEILLDEDGGEGIKFYTGGSERMVVGADGNLYVPGLAGLPCFLEATADGKVKCYTGGVPPGGNVLATTQTLVASASGPSSCDSYTILVGDVEKVVRVSASLSAFPAGDWGEFWFRINGVQKLHKQCDWTCRTWSTNRYYHVIAGDVLQVCTNRGGGGGATARIYTMGYKRELITHAFSDGNILYWYDQAVTGEMSPAGVHYIGPEPAVSVIVSAIGEEDVTWILD